MKEPVDFARRGRKLKTVFEIADDHSRAEQGAAKRELPMYDYELMEKGVRQQVRAAAVEIHGRNRKIMTESIAIGKTLLAVKELVPHGDFLDWLEHEFDWSRTTAFRLMTVAEFVGQHANVSSLIHLSSYALYQLAAPSTPEAVKEQVIRRVELTEWLPTREDIVDLIQADRRINGLPLDDSNVADLKHLPRSEREIEGVYEVMDATESEPSADFAAWWAKMPKNELSLQDMLVVLQTAKMVAQGIRQDHNEFRNVVTNALIPWSHMINAVERRVKA